MAYCNNCGQKLRDTDKFCPNCGQKIEMPDSNYTDGIQTNQPTPEETGTDEPLYDRKNYGQGNWQSVDGSNQANNGSSNKKRPFWFSAWFIVIMLILFPPVGIVLMWLGKRFNIVVRIILTIFFAYMFYVQFKTFTDRKATSAVESRVETEAETVAETEAETAPQVKEENKNKSKKVKKTSAEKNKEADVNEGKKSLVVGGKLFNAGQQKMKIGDVIDNNDVLVGLSYAKITDYPMTAMSSKVDIETGKEVLVGYFEVHNASFYSTKLSHADISAYADGNLLANPDSMMLLQEDGISQRNNNEIDRGTRMLLLVEYVIPQDWSTATFFYGNSSWEIKNTDISKEPYGKESVFTPSISRVPTEVGSEVYSGGDYTLVYDGIETRPKKYEWSGPWVVFKYTITNKSSSPLDMNLVGYKMRGYKNNYLLNAKNNISSNSIDGHMSIYDIDEIQPGMSAKIYVDFETDNTDPADYYMAFDDGYITNNAVAYIADSYKK